MKIITIAILLMLTAQFILCQSTCSPLSARYTGIGAYCKNFTDAFSGSSNQTELAEIKQTRTGIYGQKRFLLKEPGNYTAAIALPSKMDGAPSAGKGYLLQLTYLLNKQVEIYASSKNGAKMFNRCGTDSVTSIIYAVPEKDFRLQTSIILNKEVTVTN